MRIGAGLDARLGLQFDELREAGRQAARLGFESLWTPAGGIPDAFHVCTAWALDTPLRTGISVVPAARMWSPLALATQAATVGQLSEGRFVLGIGTGGYGPGFWASVGMPDRPVAVMRDYLTVVRALLAGEKVTHDGPAFRLRDASLAVGASPGCPSTWVRSARRCCAWPVSWRTGRCSTGPLPTGSPRAGASCTRVQPVADATRRR